MQQIVDAAKDAEADQKAKFNIYPIIKGEARPFVGLRRAQDEHVATPETTNSESRPEAKLGKKIFMQRERIFLSTKRLCIDCCWIEGRTI